MKLKSYFSSSVGAAIVLARKELGGEALLMNARPSRPEAAHLGAFEVVFGLPSAAETPRITEPEPIETKINAPQDNDVTRLSGDLAELKRRMEQLLSAAPTPQPALAAKPDRDPIFIVNPTLGRPGASRAIVALVGPPGAGKTTTLVKLATRYGLATRKRPRILTADVFRIAAADQLRSLAALVGIACDVVETPAALGQALEEYRSSDLIFIDTPGLGFRDIEDGAELARMLSSHKEVDTHLVLPASLQAADMARIAESYAIFAPAKLLFTRLDETSNYAALTAQAERSVLPLSFLANGQQIPDDLEEASQQRLIEWARVPATFRKGATA